MSQITTQLVLIFDETENICVDSEQKLTRFDGSSLTLFTTSRNLDSNFATILFLKQIIFEKKLGRNDLTNFSS